MSNTALSTAWLACDLFIVVERERENVCVCVLVTKYGKGWIMAMTPSVV